MFRSSLDRTASLASLALTAGILAACADTGSVTAPTSPRFDASSGPVGGKGATIYREADKACQIGPLDTGFQSVEATQVQNVATPSGNVNLTCSGPLAAGDTPPAEDIVRSGGYGSCAVYTVSGALISGSVRQVWTSGGKVMAHCQYKAH